ncbi:cystatin-like cysteine protease inhibitor domain-containing protein [Trypanosoma theileri]|uniref:Cystatin-like cysteine protease inhibitor domain-containing protein n=1 Tax=Trypanosoma theileri TaxID=67003 RepID=A0A1X0PA14_9TRYP|nr:cystatin-like cysteine protease inhibitor domain-containing protein [Trypanosoma theileri]ORC93671.1 cystatin-like cysteine protease inhibitor domain-containing protein [Trypanosoma theileri]
MLNPRLSLRELCQGLSTSQRIIILYVFTNSLAGSIWMSNAWTPFIYQIFGNSNLHVGLLSALNGAFELIFALIGGHLADRVVGPSETLLISARVGMWSLITIMISVWIGNWVMLIISQSLYGAYLGLSLTSVESVFAQSIQQGERDHLYGVKFSLEASAPIGGLVLSLILFALFGNTWRLDVLRWIITAGVLLHLASIQTLLSRFKPIPSHLDKAADDIPLEIGQTIPVNLCNREEPRVFCVEEEITNCGVKEEKSMNPLSHLDKNDQEKNLQKTSSSSSSYSSNECQSKDMNKNNRCAKCIFYVPLEKYPYVIALSDIVITLGSGMTTQYFSLFMMNIYHISPVGLSSLGLLIAMTISILAIVNSHIGKKFGRTRALLPPKLLGTFILLYMALARGTLAAPTWLMCIAYVARMALMNSTTALSRALIMDIVSEERRGMWNAVESFQSASWSGTALLGGFLADRLGYGAAFIVTFGFHLTACLMISPCLSQNDTVLTLHPNGSTLGDKGEIASSHKTTNHSSCSHIPVVDEVTILNVTVTEELSELKKTIRENKDSTEVSSSK